MLAIVEDCVLMLGKGREFQVGMGEDIIGIELHVSIVIVAHPLILSSWILATIDSNTRALQILSSRGDQRGMLQALVKVIHDLYSVILIELVAKLYKTIIGTYIAQAIARRDILPCPIHSRACLCKSTIK